MSMVHGKVLYLPRGSLLTLVHGEKKQFCMHHSQYSGHWEVGASQGSSGREGRRGGSKVER